MSTKRASVERAAPKVKTGKASVGAVVVAAGGSTRMRGTDKLFVSIAGRLLLAHALGRLQESPIVERIVLVVSRANLERGRELVRDEGFEKVRAVCEGGRRRQDSVRLGLEALSAAGGCDWVLVQDGARLLVECNIAEGLEAARETGAAVPVVPIADTVKEVGEDGSVSRTVDRARLRAAQTPQVFLYELLVRAHREVKGDVTDDAAMVEAIGVPVRLFAGSTLNLKVTTVEDLRLAEGLLEGETRKSQMESRSGKRAV